MAKITPTPAEVTRLERAREALPRYAVTEIQHDGERQFLVTKVDDLTTYRVTADHRCTCPDSVQRSETRCKHFWMVVLSRSAGQPAPVAAPVPAAVAAPAPAPWHLLCDDEFANDDTAGDSPAVTLPPLDAVEAPPAEEEWTDPDPAPSRRRPGNPLRLHEILDAAAEHVQHPRLTLLLEETTIVVKRAGPGSKNPDSIVVVGEGRYPDAAYYGRVIAGCFFPSRDCPQAVRDSLQYILEDPDRALAEHGRETGICACCARELTDPRSVEAGYGPVCAAHWGLPWGSRAPATA